MSSIMRARSGLTGRGEVAEVIGALSRAEGCWPFDARDRMPRSSRATAHYLVENTLTVPRAPSRASGFVHRPIGAVAALAAPMHRSFATQLFEIGIVDVVLIELRVTDIDRL